jgi:L-lysine 2,3-aminomutase
VGHVPDDKGTTGAGSSRSVNDLEEIEQIELTDEERDGLSAPGRFRVDITPYFISLIDPKDRADPIRRQVIPLGLRAPGVHCDDGGQPRRGPPLPGARPRPSLRIASSCS